ncbi:unnamed protein product [Sphagnum balticum]
MPPTTGRNVHDCDNATYRPHPTMSALDDSVTWPLIVHRYARVGFDSVMIVVGLSSGIAGNVVMSMSTTTTLVYIARVYTTVEIVVQVASILSSFIINYIYRYTLHIWPGTVFALVASMECLVMVLMMYVIRFYANQFVYNSYQLQYRARVNDAHVAYIVRAGGCGRVGQRL